MALADVFAPIGVTISSGDLELRGLDDDSLLALADLARQGIHDPSFMPFSIPWTDVSPEELPRHFLQYHWLCRAEFSPDRWTLNLGTWWRGELVGTQGISTEGYLESRTAETGSWLGRRFQGQGIGTHMRRAMCALLFDELGARWVTSAAYVDNPSSLAVSRRVGYRFTEVVEKPRRDTTAPSQQLELGPQEFDRGGLEFTYGGVPALRALVGLTDA